MNNSIESQFSTREELRPILKLIRDFERLEGSDAAALDGYWTKLLSPNDPLDDSTLLTHLVIYDFGLRRYWGLAVENILRDENSPPTDERINEHLRQIERQHGQWVYALCKRWQPGASVEMTQPQAIRLMKNFQPLHSAITTLNKTSQIVNKAVGKTYREDDRLVHFNIVARLWSGSIPKFDQKCNATSFLILSEVIRALNLVSLKNYQTFAP